MSMFPAKFVSVAFPENKPFSPDGRIWRSHTLTGPEVVWIPPDEPKKYLSVFTLVLSPASITSYSPVTGVVSPLLLLNGPFSHVVF